MPFYYTINRKFKPEARRRVAQGLLALKEQLAAHGVPRRTVSETLLLATWNIREFDSAKYGRPRLESLYYIAEIISHFDLVAIQEVREDLTALEATQDILGGWWKYIVTDVTEGTAGNKERMAFLYDSRKVTFGGLAGEVVLPGGRDGMIRQLARTPFICGFKAGWSKFNLCTVHIYYGDDSPDNERRVGEIKALAELLAKRARVSGQPPATGATIPMTYPENLILLGDFNIFSRSDVTMQALTEAGFVIPEELQSVPGSNVDQSKHYDQIAFMIHKDRLDTTRKAGVFDFYESVYRQEDHALYAEEMGEAYQGADDAGKVRYFRQWRTYQMSDHLPMWVELKIDFGTEYLQERAG